MNTKKPACKYGDKCYRKNPKVGCFWFVFLSKSLPKHFEEYSHPQEEEEEQPSPMKKQNHEKPKVVDFFVDFCSKIVFQKLTVCNESNIGLNQGGWDLSIHFASKSQLKEASYTCTSFGAVPPKQTVTYDIPTEVNLGGFNEPSRQEEAVQWKLELTKKGLMFKGKSLLNRVLFPKFRFVGFFCFFFD